MALAALGVVYGDIGTSPLYALRECFSERHVNPEADNILGVLSLIFWALILVVSVKYLVFVLRAHNNGEGGILALMALALRSSDSRMTRRRATIVALGLFGAALLYGDSVITPAISVLSAVEGLKVATPVFEPFIVPIAVVILAGLFSLQPRGTAQVGRLFGPVTLIWLVCLSVLGVRGIINEPGILYAINPVHAVRFFVDSRLAGFVVLGAVFLVVTGGEALYADMGHFGTLPIRLAWFFVALPALLLNYFGQGALLLHHPDAIQNPFFLLVPSWALYPTVILSTAATVIASQAVISGAFSLAKQAVQLGYSPRMRIIHTSAQKIGQIFLPGVNKALFVGVVVLVLSFRSSSNLAAAYGIAVTSTMVITTLLTYTVATNRWRWPWFAAWPWLAVFLTIDVSFLASNAIKVKDGGWISLGIGFTLALLMATWKKGRRLLEKRLHDSRLPLDQFFGAVAQNSPVRVPGVAVFMAGKPEGTPPALVHSLKHMKAIHEDVILLTVVVEEEPSVAPDSRFEINALAKCFWRVTARYGFMEDIDVIKDLSECTDFQLADEMSNATFVLGRESLRPVDQPGMAKWRKSLFARMSANALMATSYFNLPADQVVEFGVRLEL